MIRPFTCIALLLACGSGLYLYQAKHRVKLLDDRIAQTVKSTDALREQTRMLSAEWTLLNDPLRLRQLADQFLKLQTVAPTQFTSLADLDSRLPPPLPQGAPPAGAAAPLVAEQTPPQAVADAHQGQDAASTPARLADTGAVDAAAARASHPAAAAPAVPRDRMVATAEAHDAAKPPRVIAAPLDATRGAGSHATQRAVAGLPRSVEPTDQRWVPHRAADVHEVVQRSFVPRAMEPRPVMATRAPAPLPAAGGSFLGMAHDAAAPPPPRPMPVGAPFNSYGMAGG